jgi:hypothetical protein
MFCWGGPRLTRANGAVEERHLRSFNRSFTLPALILERRFGTDVADQTARLSDGLREAILLQGWPPLFFELRRAGSLWALE